MNLFEAAKEKGATSSPKPKKEEVVVTDAKFHLNLVRLAEINSKIDELSAEGQVLNAEVKEKSIEEFVKLYESTGKYPGSFNIKATGLKKMEPASLMFIPTDKYIKIGKERYEELVDTWGENIASKETTYTMDSKLVEKYGAVISDLITKCKDIAPEDKGKLISAITSFEVKKGTISDLNNFPGTISEMLEEVKPIYQIKNIRVGEE